MGTFTSRSKLDIDDGKLNIKVEGTGKKFVDQVEQITFSGDYARSQGQSVYYVTERAVFQLVEQGLKLIELAPGVDLEKDVLAQMDFRPLIAEPLKTMDEYLFLPQVMGLDHQSMDLVTERLHYDKDSNTVFINFEGMRLDSTADVQDLQKTLDAYFHDIGNKVNVVINYDNFVVAPAAETAYFALVKRNSEKHFLSSARYSTDAFFRRRVGHQFTSAKAELYSSFSEAMSRLVKA